MPLPRATTFLLPALFALLNAIGSHPLRGEANKVETPQFQQTLHRGTVLEAMQKIMGPLPDAARRCPLELKIESETDCGAFLRQSISYQVLPGHRINAFLLTPKSKSGQTSPAVLALHPTSEDGCKTVVGLGKDPGVNYGSELAQRGYIVIAPPYPLMADYQPDLKALGFSSGTLLSIWINMRSLDVLESLPSVSAVGFGCIGHSLGGHNGVFTAAFDERIKVVVSSCGLDSFRDYYDGDAAHWEPGKGWCQLRYMPKLAEYRGRIPEIPFDFDTVLSAIAPRRIFLSAPLGDDNFRWRSVERIVNTANLAFAKYPGASPIKVIHPDGPHEFSKETREHAYQMIESTLRPPHPPAITPPEGENWTAVQGQLKAQWEPLLGASEETPVPLDLQILTEERLPQFTRQHVRYTIEEGVFADGYLLLPPVPYGKKTAGVVVFHSTVASQAKLVAGLDAAAPDKAQGVDLVKRGWVVICPRCFIFNEGGTYQANVDQMQKRHPKRTGMQRMLIDGKRALDLLESLPQVDPKRLGAIGHSLGAKETLYLAAFDTRVQVGVFSEGGLALSMSNWDAPWYLGNQIKAAAWKRDHHELLAMIAPRPFLVIAGNSADTDATLHYLNAAQPAYAAAKNAGNLQFMNHGEGHAYPPAARRTAEEFLATHLREK